MLRDGSQEVVDAKDRGAAMAEWMGDHGTELFRSMVEGAKEQYSIVPSYGYVDSDGVADAYLSSGVPAGHIFTIGNKGVSRWGYKGTHAISDRKATPAMGSTSAISSCPTFRV